MLFQNLNIHNKQKNKPIWENRRVGITGASGSLGKELSKTFRSKGAYVIGLTHREPPYKTDLIEESPNKWIKWTCGKEKELENIFKSLDLLVLNHGINPGGNLEPEGLNKALEINALSYWRLIEIFEKISLTQQNKFSFKELWVNTSEAEIQPAFSPSYEISKRLIGQLVSFRYSSLTKNQREKFRLKKLILGPFKSELNPIGLMNPSLVADKIINKSSNLSRIIIVSPNPITYILFPLIEYARELYFNLFKAK